MEMRMQSNGRLTFSVSPGVSVEIMPRDFLACMATTIGPDNWLFELIAAHSKVADALHSQNFPECQTDLYPGGEEFERLAGKIGMALMDIRDEFLAEGKTEVAVNVAV